MHFFQTPESQRSQWTSQPSYILLQWQWFKLQIAHGFSTKAFWNNPEVQAHVLDSIPACPLKESLIAGRVRPHRARSLGTKQCLTYRPCGITWNNHVWHVFAGTMMPVALSSDLLICFEVSTAMRLTFCEGKAGVVGVLRR